MPKLVGYPPSNIIIEKEIKYTFTLGEWDEASLLADKQMKETLGHEFQTILKTRCIHCGKSPRVKTRCGGWFMTLHHNLLHNLMNK